MFRLNQMVRWGQFKQAFWMLEHGADANIAYQLGWTSMHQAASRGNEKMMKALLMADGDPTLKDRTGNTPFQVARSRNNHKIVELLGG